MRSSKPRSRGKSNRNRSSGNNLNRVFDSSGPEGKVRGTPQQIIDKYQQLTRDAQLSNDRVAAENFQQHAEHYVRMLSEAQREADARREQQEAQHRERQAQRDQERAERNEQPRTDGNEQPRAENNEQPRVERQKQDRRNAPAQEGGQPRHAPAPVEAPAEPIITKDTPQPDLLDIPAQGESGLVETPENVPPPKPKRPRKPRAPKAKPAAAVEAPAPEESSGPTDSPEAAE
ncbi:DUF4167 domain-containing protein [Cochlodiniinecator piscidefendens]|uniref:DUF4167 domain-containing protein n=1 Tax=Cochlodiniinecator piscidefendens TaxID=2715756 RepID=UPI00140CA41D|nr:DUF4167 domain-containing protein [Cochlodiniinecator piscidefendens]